MFYIFVIKIPFLIGQFLPEQLHSLYGSRYSGVVRENIMKAFLAKYKIDIFLTGISFILLTILYFVVFRIIDLYWYWEGRGYFSRGSWFTIFGLSFFAGIPFFIIFVVHMSLRIQKDRRFISVIRVFMGLLFLIFPFLLFYPMFVLEKHLSLEPGSVLFSRGFRDRIESKCSVEELRTWAQTFLENREKSGEEHEIYYKEVPPFIKKLDTQNEITQHMHISVTNGIIDICCGGSPLSGHFGILIGPSDYVHEEGFTNDGGQDIYYLEWKPGIYIWYSEN